jgi:hypothetical protein
MKHDKTITNPLKVLKSTNGRFASVTYTNKEGNTKTYTVRTGVHKYTKGLGKNKVPNSITVFCVDLHKAGYKTFKRNGIKKIRCGKLKFSR